MDKTLRYSLRYHSSIPGFGFVILCAAAWASLAPNPKPKVQPSELAWPEVKREMRPWTRWWWLGSAVDKPNLTRLLEMYRAVGLGGVEITPIYGIKGQESRHIPYLSETWLDLLRHTISEAKRLDMAVDMPTGTGWPFGGPQVTGSDALDKLFLSSTRVRGGETFRLPAGPRLEAAQAASDTGQTISITDELVKLSTWTAPPGSWTIYVARIGYSGRGVKRAAPGGEGKCISPFWKPSLDHYLKRFDEALSVLPKGAIRSHFHDSFEYGADWAQTVFDEFKQRRDYDLRDHLAAMALKGDSDAVARVRTDYRETISEMLLDNFTEPWSQWAHRQSSLTRNQAHGSPGNLLDLYGAVDIPETEVFRSIGDIRITKFASSAAHVMGKPLVSSESCTWMDEHFNETLAKAKTTIDRLFLGGVNHIFYHGTAYSPQDAAWPGWMFYASTHFEPNNPIWHDFPILNAYVTRCQSILQSGKPDNDILLYWPLHDLWMKQPRVFGLPIEGKWLQSEPVGQTAQYLLDHGYSFDYVSDRQLQNAKPSKGGVIVAGLPYRLVIVPPCKFIPEATMGALTAIERAGGRVVIQNAIPSDVPGFHDLDIRRQRLKFNTDMLMATPPRYATGRGGVHVGSDLEPLLDWAQVRREALTDRHGLQFIRRSFAGGYSYFITNQSASAVDDWINLAVPAASAVIMDPMTGDIGMAKSRKKDKSIEVYAQLKQGESLIIRTFTSTPIAGRNWEYSKQASDPVTISSPWRLSFIQGGPELPKPQELQSLASWTSLGDPELQRFAGTARYRAEFDAPAMKADEWWLDLGKVCESARVRLNGKEVGAAIAPPFGVRLGKLKPKGNVLEVDVTNVAANRIRDMDRRKVPWRIFHEINFVNIDYKAFDASNWPIRESGLLGPVTLIPMKKAF